MDDQIWNIEMFKGTLDSKAGPSREHYLLLMYYKLIQCSLKKHSKRSDTNKVCKPIAIAFKTIMENYR